MLNFTENTVGTFQEKDTGNWFSYSARTNSNDFATMGEYPHLVDVLDGVRFARVLKIVAYIVVDESSDGKPIVEKWNIKLIQPLKLV
jgi:hypothetical protein